MNALSHILALTASDIRLANCGGKGNALAKLTQAGFAVPQGFCITAAAYQDFVQSHGIDGVIQSTLKASNLEDLSDLNAASVKIQDAFAQQELPAEVTADIKTAYEQLGAGTVAVRSSATAEDLPGQSFAGQHDSFLNISGFAALKSHVKRCWASLWNPQAISYRQRHNIDQHRVAMGVVVQTMVPAEVSGVLFTVDPQGQHDNCMVANATRGLGEGLVAGEIAADHCVLPRQAHSVSETSVTASHSLSVPQRQQLVSLGLAIEQLFAGTPQDIEWSFTQQQLWVLQARPITTLPQQTLSWEAPYPGAQLVRRQVVENMPAPLSPLFETLYLHRSLEQAMDNMMEEMALPVDISDFITRPLFITVNGYGYCRYDFKAHWGAVRLLPRILLWYVRRLPGWLKNLVPNWRDHGLPAYLAQIDAWQQQDPTQLSEQELWHGIQTLSHADANYWFHITLVMGVAKVSEGLLEAYLRSPLLRKHGAGIHAGDLLRGYDSPTLSAQRHLCELASAVQRQPQLAKLVAHSRAEDLVSRLTADNKLAGAAELLSGIDTHLKAHGHLIYNLDFAEPTQTEQSTPIMLALQNLVRQAAPLQQLVSRQAQLQQDCAIQRNNLRIYLGPLRRRVFDRLYTWAQRYAPHREHALHYMGAGWPVLRRLAAELGRRLTATGLGHQAEDIYFLEATEIEQWLAVEDPTQLIDLAERVALRRALQQQQRQTHPPGRVPVDVRFKLGRVDLTPLFEIWETQKRNQEDSAELSGFAVSPGKVSGVASVILDPAQFAAMQPGTILVCPTTTPAWTPLFSQATALVTDIGAPLAHGSIVAREYGIPAVLGTGNATRRIQSGQFITVDGHRGTVNIADHSP